MNNASPLPSPLVSVLIPVYNAEKHLRQCLDSVLSQTRGDFELILLNDGSTDKSGEICAAYAAKDPRITMLTQENRGNLASRIRLLDSSRGRYVLFVDADDTILPQLLDKTIGIAEKKGCDLVLFSHESMTESGKALRIYHCGYGSGEIPSDDLHRLKADFACSGLLNHLWDKLIARELLHTEWLKSGGFPDHMTGEDKLILLPVFSCAKKVYCLNDVLYRYRLSISGMTRRYSPQYFKDMATVSDASMEFMQREKIDTPENLQRSNRYHRDQAVTLCYVLVHSNAYSRSQQRCELRRIFSSQPFASLIRDADYKGVASKDLFVLYLLKRKSYGLLVPFLRFEKTVARAIKRQRN